MPSLNSYNTRAQMALDIPLCRTNKRRKSLSFPGPKILNMLNSNIKAAVTTASFTHSLKKEIMEKSQFWAISLIFGGSWFFFSLGDPNENKGRFRSF